jgi:hypothetical protein
MLRREFISLLGAATASKALAKSSGKAQMGLSLSEVSTFSATFRDDVHAYKSAGFDAIGVWEFKLPDNGSDDQILASLHEANLKVATCVPAVAYSAIGLTPSARARTRGSSQLNPRGPPFR